MNTLLSPPKGHLFTAQPFAPGGLGYPMRSTGALPPGQDIVVLRLNGNLPEIVGFSSQTAFDEVTRLVSHARSRLSPGSDLRTALENLGYWNGPPRACPRDGSAPTRWASVAPLSSPDGSRYFLVTLSSTLSAGSPGEPNFLATHTDPVTGIPNRQYFDKRLTHAISRAARTHRKLAVLILDIDRFKPINDALGSAVGDSLLREIATRLASLRRLSGSIARIGADQFAIIGENADTEAAVSDLAHALSNLLSTPFHILGQEIVVTGSIGISLFPQHGDSFDTLLGAADCALAQAKASGHAKQLFYDPGMSTETRKEFALSNDLRRALREHSLEVHYQPQIHLPTSGITGAEALIRWNHPAHGWIAPDVLIPLAEGTGQIEALGSWVLQESCRTAREWQSATRRDISVSVNISTLQLKYGGLEAAVRSALDASGLPAHLLELELTETQLLDHSPATIGTLASLKALGVRIAIDDFGTGYSSLSYLKQLSVHKLKISKEFVSDIGHSDNDDSIVSAIAAIGRTLGITLNAEGVETPEQLDFLSGIGCEEVQGFLYSKALPPSEFRDFLRGNATRRDL